jgi:hypothetical protein
VVLKILAFQENDFELMQGNCLEKHIFVFSNINYVHLQIWRYFRRISSTHESACSVDS